MTEGERKNERAREREKETIATRNFVNVTKHVSQNDHLSLSRKENIFN